VLLFLDSLLLVSVFGATNRAPGVALALPGLWLFLGPSVLFEMLPLVLRFGRSRACCETGVEIQKHYRLAHLYEQSNSVRMVLLTWHYPIGA